MSSFPASWYRYYPVDLIRDYDRHVSIFLVHPYMQKCSQFIQSARREFRLLSERYFPSPKTSSSNYTKLSPCEFKLLSERKDMDATVRRYTMGIQARGLHLVLGSGILSMEEHVRVAQSLEHPLSSAAKHLHADWKHVFARMSTAFFTRGVEESSSRLVEYRTQVMQWIRRLAAQLQPLRREMLEYMPPSAKIVASKVHFPLFYVLLAVTGFQNPQMAFRFWIGAPLVGEFFSAALPARDLMKGTFSNAQIEYIAWQCFQKESFVTAKLDAVAAAKSMQKMDKEFATQTLVGPFESREELRIAIEKEIRQNPDLQDFELDIRFLVVSPQFTVSESHAYAEKLQAEGDTSSDPVIDYKVRNIFNGKKLNGLSSAASTYIPCSHADVSAIVMNWIAILQQFAFPYNFLGWPSDFAAAYRQMPLSALHLMFAGCCYYDYRKKKRRYAFYRALPFGSSLAPAEWSETVIALSHICAIALLLVLTHCVDDVCNIEIDLTVHSARSAFVELCELLGLTLDPDKTLCPSDQFIYLGLCMILPAKIPRRVFAFSIPETRRLRLLYQIQTILGKGELTPAEASTMRGRLYFYAYWQQQARAFLTYLSRRQYAQDADRFFDSASWPLSPELIVCFAFFMDLLKSQAFQAGLQPEALYNRKQAIIYTDGSRSETERGIGGICYIQPEEGQPVPSSTFYSMIIDDAEFYPHIACVEMRAVLHALELFGPSVHGRAIIFFIDNTHALGCLLRRSSPLTAETLDERSQWRSRNVNPNLDFESLSENIKLSMNVLAQKIWAEVTKHDLLVWWEYVNTKLNIADPPSRGYRPPEPTRRVGNEDWILKPFCEFVPGEGD